MNNNNQNINSFLNMNLNFPNNNVFPQYIPPFPPINNNNYQNNNMFYEFQINELYKQLNEERNKNQILMNEITRLNVIINNLNNQINDLINQNNGIQNNENIVELLRNEIKEKNIEIQNYKSKYELSITSVNPGENVFAINFISNDIQNMNHYSLACKNVNLFVRLEEKLNNDFPQLKEHEIYFEVNGKRIKRFKTLDENQIKSNDIIHIFLK